MKVQLLLAAVFPLSQISGFFDYPLRNICTKQLITRSLSIRGRGKGEVFTPHSMSLSTDNAAPRLDSRAEPTQSTPNADVKEDKMKTLVMYVIVRRDLKWPLGSVVAQGAHAATAILWEAKDEPNVALYCQDIDRMHKIILGADNESQLRNAAESLAAEGLRHRLWVEQPEGIATALATMPYPRGRIAPLLKKLPLLK